MKNNKLIYSILAIIFIIVFSLFNLEEYKSFHAEKKEILEQEIKIKKSLEDFELKNIKEINDIEFYNTPDKGLLVDIVNKIDHAENYIYLEVYMLTETRIQEALIRAYKKGISIKIILEKDPYLAYNINDKAYNKLTNAGIDVVWSKKEHYSFNHSKVLLIDDLSIISTGNYSYSTFTQNRDLFIITGEKNIHKKLLENFDNDFLGIKKNIYDDNLVFSPNGSRIKFEKMFEGAEKNISMYFQYFKDDKLVEKIIEIKKEKDLELKIIIPDTAKEDINVLKLKKSGAKIFLMSKNKMHAKAILIDEKYLFVGSINFSDYSIDKNREVGILIINTKIINEFLNLFKQDIKNTTLQ